MQKSIVQIFILTHNRPQLVVEALDSALAQTYPNIEVIVSDNSTNNETQDLLIPYKSRNNFRYIRRRTDLGAIDHFNVNINEATGTFLMLFHDDDILLPNAIADLVSALENDAACVAAAGNALYLDDNIRTERHMMTPQKNTHLIKSPVDLTEIYLTSGDHPAFSSYLYRASAIRDLVLSLNEGGKYCDVSFLLKTSKKGHLLWLPQNLIYYRIHQGNDSAHIDIKAALSLAQFIEYQGWARTKLIDFFKMRHYFALVKREGLKEFMQAGSFVSIITCCAKAFLLNPKQVFKRISHKLKRDVST